MSEAGLGGRQWTLEWAVKKSFTAYVRSMPDGSIEPIGTAAALPEKASWAFAPAPPDREQDERLQLRFSGELRFRAHHGMLLVILVDPWLTETDSGVELSVVDLTAWPDRSRREVLARGPAIEAVPLSVASVTVPLELAETAVDTFNGVYPPGTPLEPAILTAIRPGV